jgi:DNA-binding transcriptional LysR family regulator
LAGFLPDILRDYLICSPQIQVQVLTATTRIIMEMLRQNKIDLILTLDNRVYAPIGNASGTTRGTLCFFACRVTLFANRVVSLSEVVKENLLLTEKRRNHRQTFEQICMERHLQLRSSLEIGCANTILIFTQHNLGISFFARIDRTGSP